MQKKSKVVAVIAVEYDNLKKSSHAKLPDHTLSNLIESKIEESGIREEDPDYTIPKKTILSRLTTGNLTKSTKGISSPLQSMEPILVELILQKAQMGQHLNMKDSFHLANSLMQGSDYQKAMVIFKKKLGYTGESLEQLGPQL
mmetsp:Transcript_27042/g.38327  ORF Transcript_27042/g.38327 Transcript_27042/m.38327 type:complete len:143 (-) Transcript_27042:412-840(-)